MKAKKVRHIEKLRRRHLLNRKHIMKVIKLTAFEYNEMIFEVGILFLENLWTRDTHERQYKEASCDKKFWEWFKLEWGKRESGLIEFLKFDEKPIEQDEWEERMKDMALNENIKLSFFYDYIKL